MRHSNSTLYRPDIDGLRAIAVTSVVLYHAGLRAFPGGYVGVDVFYVISGFLITSIILADLQKSRFSILRFYNRRIRRLFPALIAMAIPTSVVAWFVLMPLDFKEYGESLAAASLFSSNLYFYLKSGYFEQQSSLRPLLHTWSLAVEEQYYAFFPILMIGLFKFRKNAISGVIIAIWFVSLGASIYEVHTDASAAFYLIWFRAWELLSGAIIALGIIPVASGRRISEAFAGLGLILLIGPIFWYDKQTIFPGETAIAPVIGTALIIFAGLKINTFASKLLSLRAAVFIGEISYSVYLWHWPIFVFARYIQPYELSQTEGLILATCAFGMGYLSWRFVEPLQDWKRERIVPVFAGAALCILVSIGFGIIARTGDGLPSRLPPEVAKLGMVGLDVNPRRSECNIRSATALDRDDTCLIGAPNAPLTFAVIGDSFADALSPGIDAMAREAGRRGYAIMKGGCAPLLGVAQVTGDCPAFVAAAFRLIHRHQNISSVILIGRWTAISEGTRFGADTMNKMYVSDDQTFTRSYNENRKVLERGLERDFAALSGRQVFITAFVPEQRVNVPRTMAMQEFFDRPSDISVDRATFDQRQKFMRELLEKMALHHHFDVIDVGSQLCNSVECLASRNGLPLYADDNHLSTHTALEMRTLFAPVFYAGNSSAIHQ